MSNNILCSIQARLGSTRLPGKVLFSLGPRRVLGWVVERARCAKISTDLILTLGDQPENAAIREWCDRNEITHNTGPEENLLKRHLQAATIADSNSIVRITADCPFVPSAEIDRVIQAHEASNAQYTTNVTDEMPIGTAVDVIDRKVLEELNELGDSHPVRRLRKNPNEWNVQFTSNNKWSEVSEAHLAVDTPDDYWRLIDAINTVGEKPMEVAKWISEQ